MQRWVRVFVLCVIGIAGPASAASSPRWKCQSTKNQEVGKYAACLGKAQAKLVQNAGACSVSTATVCFGSRDCPTGETCTKDLTAYQATLAKCGEKLTAKWAAATQKASGGGAPCPDGLTVEVILSLVGRHTTQIATALAGGDLPSGDCGNRRIDAGEDCDLGTLSLDTCVSEGFAGGVLRCGADCRYDASGCYTQRFADNQDGTISDNVTKLMWEKKVALDSGADYSNPQNADNVYRWSGTCRGDSRRLCQPDVDSEAACRAGADAATTGCALCPSSVGPCNVGTAGTIWQWLVALNAANFGGHSDWRVPTRWEFDSILDWEDGTPPTIDEAFHGPSCGPLCDDVSDPHCSCTASSQSDGAYYWSASAYVQDEQPDAAWVVDFFETAPSQAYKEIKQYRARAVRGGN